MVVFSGGGTGGHLYPALSLAAALEALRPDVRSFFVGARRGIEARVLPERELPHLLLPIRGVHRRRLWSNLGVLPALFRSLAMVYGAFRRLRPELVVVTGGYAGGPAGVVAGLTGIPLALQEQNSVPGVTTRVLSRWARRIHVAFPEAVARLPRTSRSRALVSGNPVRPPRGLDPKEARRQLGFEASDTVVLVVGGSQGSVALNRGVLGALEGVVAGVLERPGGLRILWATGPEHEASMAAEVGRLGADEWVTVVGYIHEMPRALAAADLAVSRAGAMATSEFLAWGLPAVLVPLPTAAADHQSRNAEALAASGAAIHLPEPDLTGEVLWRAILGLVLVPERLHAMASAAVARGRPRAASEIVADLASLLPASQAGAPEEGKGGA